MNLKAYATRSAMGKAAGKAVEEKIIALLTEKEGLRMIFAAAPSQNEFFAYLRQSPHIPWDSITAFHMDEYIGLPPDHPAQFSNFLKRNLFDHVNLNEVHLINGNNDPEEECARYGALLMEKDIDIVCLGIGENGHIAFNDPPVADFEDPKVIKKVSLDIASRQQQVNDGCFPALEEVPLEALTLTIPSLMQAAYLFCIVPGALKREAVKNAVNGPVSTTCPASILQTHAHCGLFVTNDAYPAEIDKKSYTVQGINCLSGKVQSLVIQDTIVEITDLSGDGENLPFFGPGLIDLQVNGIHGIDFNDPELTIEGIHKATQYLLNQGITSYFPTLITNSDENILRILGTIQKACDENPLVDACIAGLHIEGPFLSMMDGARGAHNKKYIKPPSWDLIEAFQIASGGRIRLITLAPEWGNAPEFIAKCRKEGILISIGHTSATPHQIQAGVLAGATLSTHLGNGIPLMLPRHPNLLWEQLANDELYISIIADGFHLPDSFIKVALKVKDERVLLVSDATCFSGMEPGEYRSHIGDEVVLHEGGKLAMKNSNGLLAGATKSLLENVQFLLERHLVSLDRAWAMGSAIPAKFMGMTDGGIQTGKPLDMVLFHLNDHNKIRISKVIKNGKVVFEQPNA